MAGNAINNYKKEFPFNEIHLQNEKCIPVVPMAQLVSSCNPWSTDLMTTSWIYILLVIYFEFSLALPIQNVPAVSKIQNVPAVSKILSGNTLE